MIPSPRGLCHSPERRALQPTWTDGAAFPFYWYRVRTRWFFTFDLVAGSYAIEALAFPTWFPEGLWPDGEAIVYPLALYITATRFYNIV